MEEEVELELELDRRMVLGPHRRAEENEWVR